MSTLDKVLTASEASRKYRLSSRRVRDLVRNQTVRGRWADGVWLVERESFEHYLAHRPQRGRPRKIFS